MSKRAEQKRQAKRARKRGSKAARRMPTSAIGQGGDGSTSTSGHPSESLGSLDNRPELTRVRARIDSEMRRMYRLPSAETIRRAVEDALAAGGDGAGGGCDE